MIPIRMNDDNNNNKTSQRPILALGGGGDDWCTMRRSGLVGRSFSERSTPVYTPYDPYSGGSSVRSVDSAVLISSWIELIDLSVMYERSR